MKCFEMKIAQVVKILLLIWTLNMKCFEININTTDYTATVMNLKHEMFWNTLTPILLFSISKMNLKHEMFWNFIFIFLLLFYLFMNLKHEMFWNLSIVVIWLIPVVMNLKHEMFWNRKKVWRNYFFDLHEP